MNGRGRRRPAGGPGRSALVVENLEAKKTSPPKALPTERPSRSREGFSRRGPCRAGRAVGPPTLLSGFLHDRNLRQKPQAKATPTGSTSPASTQATPPMSSIPSLSDPPQPKTTEAPTEAPTTTEALTSPKPKALTPSTTPIGRHRACAYAGVYAGASLEEALFVLMFTV